MMKKRTQVILLPVLILVAVLSSCNRHFEGESITVFPDSVLSDISHHPVGINLDFFMDDDKTLKPAVRTADALKSMGVRYLRYPGGNKSDLYLFSSHPWERSLPDLARKGTPDIGYDRVLSNFTGFRFDILDFDEFIELCRETGCEPVIVVAADEYLVDYPEGTKITTREDLITHAAEWVRYSNIKRKYNVKYWMIGNECWHENNPNSNAEIYAKDVVDFSKAMKSIDPSIAVIPNGNSLEFCETVLRIAGDHIDYFCISNYPVYKYQAGYATYRDTMQDLMGPVRRALKAIDNQGFTDKLKLIVAEYGPFDWAYSWPMVNDLGHTLCNFEMGGEQLCNDRIEFSCFWNTRWIDNDSIENEVWDALDKNGNLNSTGLGLKIWGNYLGSNMIATQSIPRVKCFSSIDPKKELLWIYLINKAESPSLVNLNINSCLVKRVTFCGRLSGTGPEDFDPVWKENIHMYPGMLKRLSLPGVSVTVIGLKIKHFKNKS